MKKKAFKKPEHLKMSKKSEKALDKTIEHWFRVRDEDEEVGPGMCELCKKFQKCDGVPVICPKCPVRNKTGKDGCVNTPYGRYAAATPFVEEFIRKQFADDEIEFLQSCYY